MLQYLDNFMSDAIDCIRCNKLNKLKNLINDLKEECIKIDKLEDYNSYIKNTIGIHKDYSSNNNALHEAVCTNNIELIKFIYELYPLLSEDKNYSHETPFELYYNNINNGCKWNAQVFAFLQKRYNKFTNQTTDLIVAVANDDIEKVDNIICDYNINLRENTTLSAPLHVVKNVKMAELLLSRGANIEITNCWLQTPYMVSVQSKNIGLINFFLDHKCNTKAKDINNNIALDYCFKKDYINIYKILQRKRKQHEILYR